MTAGRPSRRPEQLRELMRERLHLQRPAVRGDHRAARAGRRDRRRRVRQDHGDGRARGLAGRHRPGRAGRGARADVHDQGGRRAGARGSATACATPGCCRARRRPRPTHEATRRSRSPRWRPTTPTPPALLTEHGLRIGHEPDTRLIADATRYQLAARAVARYTAPVEHLSDSPRHVVHYLLALDARAQRAPRRARDRSACTTPRRAAAVRGGMADRDPQDLPRANREGDPGDRPPGRAARAGRGLPRAQAPPRADGLLRPDRARRPAGRASVPRWASSSATSSRSCCSTSTRTPRSPRP